MLRKHHLATAVACVSAAVFATAVSAAAPNQRPITKPGYDPTAERVELFAGIEQEALEVQVIAKDEFGGNLLITNKTDKPLTVELPDSIVGVQVLPQDDFGFGDSGSSGSSGGGGQNQSFGGGLGGGLGGGGFGGGGLGGGGGFFSIPAERSSAYRTTPSASNTASRNPIPARPTRSSRSKSTPTTRTCRK